MKNILKYTAMAFALVASLAACEEFEDFSQKVEGASKLVYVNAGTDNFFSTMVAHRPTGSSGSFSTEFVVRSNTPVHGDATVSLIYDASLVESYNAEHETAYAVLPEQYLTLENTSLALPANAVQTEEAMKVSLSGEADFAALTERYYLAALRLDATGIGTSEQMGAIYLLVETEINLIRPITSADDMVGFPAGNRSDWTADCGNFAYLFDGKSSSSVEFSRSGNVLTVDMKENQMVTGLRFNGSGLSMLTLEYSLDGKSWEQGGTPAEGEAILTGSAYYAAVYDYIEARYLRLSFAFSSSSNVSVNELDVYTIESTDPTLYTLTGENNVVTGKLVHKKGVGSTCDLDASFKVYTTVSLQSGYNVTLSADNSLVAAYNEKNGTSYMAVPVENLNIENASITIAAGDNASADEVRVSLTGDLSGLTAKNGYLVPLKLSALSGAVVSESRGTVYAVISVENNLIRAISSVDDMIGFAASGSSSWTADCSDGANLFDGNNSTAVSGLISSGNVVTIDMKSSHMVTGLHFYTYDLSNLSISYSVDGDVWETAGTVASGENVFTGSSWSPGDYYMAFADYLDVRYLRLSFGFSGYYRNLYEMEVYEIESSDPTIYAQCGTDNVLTGTIIQHTIAGTIPSVNASFGVLTTIASANGYEVDVEIDNSLVGAYNSAHNTSYASLDASLVKLENVPCTIAAGANKSADEVKVSLTGDLSGLTNTNGYLIPLRLKAPAGAVVSEGRGTVYVAVSIETSSDPFRTNFTIEDIDGTEVTDRSAWTIIKCDEEGIYTNDSSQYSSLFDSSRDTYVRTWGGPISFTVDLGRNYDMTGLVITARSGSYQRMQPKSIMIEYSTDNVEYELLGTPASADGNLVASVPSSYVALYGSQQVRYLRIVADYGGSNMGTAEFNIYAK